MNAMQVPDITNYTMVNRTYRYFEGEPLFPFGYGLYVIRFSLIAMYEMMNSTGRTLLLSTLILSLHQQQLKQVRM